MSPVFAKHTRLPDERNGITHKFTVGGHEGYITVGRYPDKAPGEIFLVSAKEGSMLSGFLDTLAMTASLALQHGVPPKAIVKKWLNMRFEPSGATSNPDIPFAHSIVDYLARWLAKNFLTKEECDEVGIKTSEGVAR